MKLDFLYHIPSENEVVHKNGRSVIENGKIQAALEQAAELIENADAIVIGGGSGLSSSCGYEYYHNCDFFERHFSQYREKYGFTNLFEGLNYVYSMPEERWSFLAHYIQTMREEPAGEAYRMLQEIVAEKEHFILTTNIDNQFYKVFQKEKIWAFQGDVSFLQCPQPCHDAIYDNLTTVQKMQKNARAYTVSADDIPRCPYCGRQLSLWVREETFLEGEEWNWQKQRYQSFLSAHKEHNIVFLELGVGDMTPSIIKFPFWEMTRNLKNARLICMNAGETQAPEHIKDKTVMLPMDIAEALHKLRRMIGEKRCQNAETGKYLL